MVIQDVLTCFADKKIYVSQYSAPLFEGSQAVVCDGLLDVADAQDVCFTEKQTLGGYVDKISTLIIYRWNRRYPADLYFDVEPEKCGFRLAESAELVGWSHEKITKEVYVK